MADPILDAVHRPHVVGAPSPQPNHHASNPGGQLTGRHRGQRVEHVRDHQQWRLGGDLSRPPVVPDQLGDRSAAARGRRRPTAALPGLAGWGRAGRRSGRLRCGRRRRHGRRRLGATGTAGRGRPARAGRRHGRVLPRIARHQELPRGPLARCRTRLPSPSGHGPHPDRARQALPAGSTVEPRCGSGLAVPAGLVGWSEPGNQAKGGEAS